VNDLDRIFDILRAHDVHMQRALSLIPSENTLSPLARLPFLSDAYSRYFFDEREVFGKWSFQGGSIVGEIQREVLVPLARRVCGADHVDVRAVSGLNAMTVALGAFGGPPGSRVITVPPAAGGHPATAYVAARLGLLPLEMPFRDWATVDLDGLSALVEANGPSLVYLDHATVLFPLDIRSIVDVVRSSSAAPVHVHVDSSHVNALIWGGVLEHPLDAGADSYGGSTHKTFAGPHKALLLTRSCDVAERLTNAAVNLVSHHHMSEVVSLAISLLEFDQCGGRDYASQILANAAAFASALADAGIDVQRRDWRFTATHQVWFDVVGSPHAASERLFDDGVIVNPYDPLPSLGRVGIRTGVNEVTRLGMREDDLAELGRVVARSLERDPMARLAIADLRQGRAPAYCFGRDVFERCLDTLISGASLVEFLYHVISPRHDA
jgi:glycine/serine hydroxymethyltransferase